ncbi:MAG TPA: hypothetical protein VHB21_21595 [Minicystis sp.]|nr:hypothetical protein [Minicystis sp.]
MQNRGTMLLVTGALAFGSLGYFLFLYDDGSTPRWTTSLHPLHKAKIGAGASSGSPATAPPRIDPGHEPERPGAHEAMPHVAPTAAPSPGSPHHEGPE